MQFIVRAIDGEGALPRRMAARPAHLELGDSLKEQGKMLFAAALLDEAGAMIGSTVVYDVSDRAELDALLAMEPYVVQNVWQTIEITQCKVGPSFAVKR